MNDRRKALWQGLLLGLGAAAFFSVSFVLNRKMADAAGHWAWSASLRFLMMVPVLALVISARGQWPRFREMWRISPIGWIVWGSLGCGIFYATLTAACSVPRLGRRRHLAGGHRHRHPARTSALR